MIQNICVFPSKVVRDVLPPARERRDPHKTPHLRTKKKHKSFSLELVSHEVTRIAINSAFLEFATGATGDAGTSEVVSKTAPQTPPPTHAGGQDDGSYTNSLKLNKAELLYKD